MLSTKPIWELSTEQIESWTFKNNLNANIIMLARKLNINISNETNIQKEQELNTSLSIQDARSLLGKDLNRNIVQGLKKFDIWYLEQLLDREGTHMITWQQLKKFKKASTKGRKAK
jgi:hypothetical protein